MKGATMLAYRAQKGCHLRWAGPGGGEGGYGAFAAMMQTIRRYCFFQSFLPFLWQNGKAR